MAKSLRSKSKKRFRAIKRAKNAPKELAKLKKILPTKPLDVEMKEMVTVRDPEELKKEIAEKKAQKYEHNPRTLKNEHGNFPQWMSKLEVNKLRSKPTKGKKGKGKKKSKRKNVAKW